MIRVRPLGSTLVVILCSKLFRSCARAPAIARLASASVCNRFENRGRNMLRIRAPYFGAPIRTPHSSKLVPVAGQGQTRAVQSSPRAQARCGEEIDFDSPILGTMNTPCRLKEE